MSGVIRLIAVTIVLIVWDEFATPAALRLPIAPLRWKLAGQPDSERRKPEQCRTVTQMDWKMTQLALTFQRWRSALRLGGTVLLGLSSGCDLPDRHDIGMFRKPAAWEVTDASASERDRIEPSGLSRGSDAEAGADDTWQFWYLHQVESGDIVGGVEMQSQRITSVGTDDQIQVTLHERVLVESDASVAWTPTQFRYMTSNGQTFWYALDGGLVRSDSKFRIGPVEQSRLVEVSEKQIRFTADGFSNTQSKTIALPGILAGPLAVYRSLLGHPLAPHKQRKMTLLLPLQESTADLRIEGQPPALARRLTDQGVVMDSLREAIAVVAIDASRQRQQYFWYDDQGVVQATNVSGDPRFTYRCEENQYNELAKPVLQQQYPVVVDVPGEQIAPGQLTLLALDVEQSPNSLASTTSTWPGITAAPRQYVQEIDSSHQRVVMAGPAVSLAKFAGLSPRYDSPVELADLAETPVLNYRSTGVKKVLGVAATMAGTSNEEKAVELNRTVHSLLSFVPLSTGVRSASDIAQTGLADSTEHAILLAAMLRANYIPARLAVGLRYLPEAADESVSPDSLSSADPTPTYPFVYHAWVTAKVEDGWIALDPTTGQLVGPECLTLDITDASNLKADGFVNRYLAILRSLRLRVSAAVVES
ncbi:Transglutaminase-like superfamily protein [Allorhodopirellula heiligendammensis]|uniref:Transglutaminase-like superfamily protein n=1 Tax=Allorhodopirellula heiligendammensis TaxID=2714739 RepID=A0A5C6C4L9_9BACT|nr:Transglutaminase-like superfamily protein [Allorhodopirellula heiligendammensis]